jgi:hypothetical protein
MMHVVPFSCTKEPIKKRGKQESQVFSQLQGEVQNMKDAVLWQAPNNVGNGARDVKLGEHSVELAARARKLFRHSRRKGSMAAINRDIL